MSISNIEINRYYQQKIIKKMLQFTVFLQIADAISKQTVKQLTKYQISSFTLFILFL